ncbi:Gfo/Idh/MocA family protein [Paraburkholderia fungorum]|uniref:Gfo/Idh/MocA family protein n=1 Tax=Paraburkholderia fungorum TaxID=134537 RepID=UPI0038B8CC3F
MDKRFRVGIIGLSAGRGWASAAHIPALRALPDEFEIAGVANTSKASAMVAAAAFELPRAFANASELINSPDVDVVAVTVKVPHHRELVLEALHAGKSVYCEWPLGNGLTETVELAELATASKLLGVVGIQAIASPEVEHVRKLVAEGYVGEVLSSTYIGSGLTWGIDVSQDDAYVMDSKNGATMLSVIGGHAIGAVQSVLGPIEAVGAMMARRRQTVRVIETDEMIPMNTPDQLMVNAVLQSGVPLSFRLRGGLPCGTRLLWEINGTEGDLRLTATANEIPVINISPLRVEGGRKGEDGYRDLLHPTAQHAGPEGAVMARNVAGIYRLMANDLRHGTRTAPNFDNAVDLHRTLRAIEESAEIGRRIRVV